MRRQVLIKYWNQMTASKLPLFVEDLITDKVHFSVSGNNSCDIMKHKWGANSNLGQLLIVWLMGENVSVYTVSQLAFYDFSLSWEDVYVSGKKHKWHSLPTCKQHTCHCWHRKHPMCFIVKKHVTNFIIILSNLMG